MFGSWSSPKLQCARDGKCQERYSRKIMSLEDIIIKYIEETYGIFYYRTNYEHPIIEHVCFKEKSRHLQWALYGCVCV